MSDIMREDTIVRRFVFELPLSGVTVVDGEKAVLECRVAVTPAAEVTWYVENVEIRQTGDCRIVFTADGWCRLIIRDDMLKNEAECTVRAVNEAGTCISTAYLTVLPAAAGDRTAKELIEQESTGVTVTIRIRPDEGLSSVVGRRGVHACSDIFVSFRHRTFSESKPVTFTSLMSCRHAYNVKNTWTCVNSAECVYLYY